MKLFFVYVDWTLEETPRAYYVGKGNSTRVKKVDRNKKHAFVSKNLGHRREIIWETWDEKAAFELEIQKIKEHNTFNSDHKITLDDIRCNKTLGGGGSNGAKRSKEMNQRRSELFKGHVVKDETKAKLSKIRQELLKTGWRPTLSDDVKAHLKIKAKEREKQKREQGYSPSPEARKNMSKAGKKRWRENPPSSQKLSEAAIKREEKKRQKRNQHLDQVQPIPSDVVPPTQDTHPD